MAIRRLIKGRYYLVRERDGKGGRKGTIIGRWHSSGGRHAA